MDFLGPTTPSELLASVTTGVQDTGTQLWPLFALIGILVAFAIAAQIVWFMDISTRDRKIKKIKSGLVDFNKKAGELSEFYSRRGRSGGEYDYQDIDRMV